MAPESIVANRQFSSVIEMKTVGNHLFCCLIFLTLFISETLFAENTSEPLSIKCGGDITAPLSTVENDPFTDSAVAALGGELTDESESDRVLRKLITKKTASPAQQFLQDRARLLLAARALRDGDTPSARELLRAIERRSPVAVDAALLLAHSFRIEKNDAEALQWFLRIAHQYPEYPSALRGLLRAGDDLMMDDKTGMAHRLFNETSQNALRMLRHLAVLPIEPMARADHIFLTPMARKKMEKNGGEKQQGAATGDNLLPDALRQQLIRKMLEQANKTIELQQAEQQYRSQWHCLLQQRARFEQQRQHAVADMTRINTALQQSRQAQELLANEIADLDSRVISGDLSSGALSSEQRQIRQRLTRARNQQTVLQAQHDFLQQTRAAMPAMLARTEKQLTLLTELYASLRDRTDDALQQDIDLAVKVLSDKFSNIAAESQWRLAELQSDNN